MSSSIYQDYFDLTKDYQHQYGQNTVVLMQVGAFFEIYGKKNTETNEITHSQITEFSQFCNLNISEKTNGHVMAGFRDYTLEKYLQKIAENGYTAVVFVQIKEGKSIKRVLHSIQSPGTFLSYETDSSPQMTNHIMCIWLEKTRPLLKKQDTLICGFSIVNIFTGKAYIYEYEIPYSLNPTTFDDLERAICVFAPSEVILISSFDEIITNTIIQYSGIKTTTIHKINVSERQEAKPTGENQNQKKAKNCQNQNYIQHIIGVFFGEETYQICGEFQEYPLATQSFCFLLDFIKEHNPNLVKKIAIPVFNNSSSRMILANHTLKQLNIIDDQSNDGKRTKRFSSILSLLNQCSSAIGSRLFQSQITNPTFDEKWLKEEYGMTATFLSPNFFPMVKSFRKQLSEIRDIEKLCRQLITKKIYPASIFYLYKSVEIIQQMNVCLYENPEILEYLSSDSQVLHSNKKSSEKENHWNQIDSSTKAFCQFIESQFYIERCRGIHSANIFDENIICQGVSKNLDDTFHKYNENLDLFEKIREYLNQLIKTCEKNNDLDHVKKHETEKSGFSLVITKTRGKILKAVFANMLKENSESTVEIEGKKIQVKDIRLVSATGSNDEITFPLLTQTTKYILCLKEELNKEIAKVYQDILSIVERDWFQCLENLTKYVGKIDVITTKAFIAREYNYCCPEILENSPKSFLNAENLRHPLIEHLNTNEIYVPNDICIGALATQGDPGLGRAAAQFQDPPKAAQNTISADGILLFGTNAVGKTSLIRAVGISLIMAQCGCFVPCSRFQYKPYTAIYSRILGNDNLFKGLSTFMVEMSELRTILKMADENSLILGDELASGTENESALSIFASGLMDLHKKRASFVFATHMHEIVHFEEIGNLENLALKHLEVYYDREQDCLVYNRKLKEGAGNRMYGLEVCRSLHMPEDFLETAMKIRGKYFPDTGGELSMKPSHFNNKKIRGLCEICKVELSEETHHMSPQRDADKNGFIGTFHKNHPANLLAVCEKCHDTIHKTPEKEKQVRKKTTKGYVLATV